ncbi:endonuclease I family protein [Alteribacillus iranensis]|uniref:Endonuclease I n=1 Tax=Alteribacillus iranensis TaxID=930128 RepID=A0A1I2F1P7_9BACI|nr:endonuclease [Alteribacillus iranensis]SFE98586.1 Endonuclease I [Alteribacillus iranensis]
MEYGGELFFDDIIEELHHLRESDQKALSANVDPLPLHETLYYDEKQDHKWMERYYRGVGMNQSSSVSLLMDLHHLLTVTHEYTYPYHITKGQFLYTWVDLQPNGKLKGLYSGVEKNPSQVMVEDKEMIEKRYAHYQSYLFGDHSSPARKKKMIHLARKYRLNTEHVVPQSWFRAKEPMKGDLHHLFACEPECNKIRSNYPYDDFSQTETRTVSNRCGSYDGERFEPRYGKGEAARATLYFLLRYPRELNKNARQKLNIQTLVKWHENSPVTRHEKHRNQAIFEIQGNRNPFIDHPNILTPLINDLYRLSAR